MFTFRKESFPMEIVGAIVPVNDFYPSHRLLLLQLRDPGQGGVGAFAVVVALQLHAVELFSPALGIGRRRLVIDEGQQALG
jgi:hypothetical protein